MSRSRYWTWVGVACVLGAAGVAAQEVATVGLSSESAVGSSSTAAVPRLIKYSGRIVDARGEPLMSVAVRLTFAVYEEQAGGAAIWAEAQMVQLDEQGHYNVLLGATRAEGLPAELFPAGKARWLGVQVEGRDEDPRVLLVSVPYALKAEDAAMLGGRRASDFVLSEQLKEEVKAQVEAQKPAVATQAVEMLVTNPPSLPAIAEGPSTFTCATTGDCVNVTQSGTGRALRTTATSASEAILIQQNGTGYGLRALVPGNIALLGQVTGSAGTSYGVKGQTTSTTGAGVFGYNLAATGLSYGVLGQTASTEGTAFFGRATSTTGATIGLRGHADSTSGTGIMGQATATSGTTTGILGRVFSLDGTALIVDNTKGGKLLSAQVNGLEKLSVSGSGNVTTSGSVTAASFGGPLTGAASDLSCTSCVAPAEVSFNYAASSSQGGAATNAVTADSAATAATATDALNLGGVAAGNFARLDTGNSFAGSQTISGDLTVNTVSGGFKVEGNATSPNLTGGYIGNSITAGTVGATIAGGGSTVGGNRVTDNYGTVGGGANNQAGDNAGGISDHPVATVAGGSGNTASGSGATVGGGAYHTASGDYGTVAGGYSNAASGSGGAVPGGWYNTAQGDYSLAAGRRAKANHDGTFVWGDSTDADVASTGANRFIVRAAGGVWFGTTSSPSWPANSFLATSTGAYLSSGGAWTDNSDRNLKEHLSPVDGRILLAQLAEVPILTWNYRVQDASIRHLGPMAQDFHAAFGLGEDDRHIAPVDGTGVALAGVQELYRMIIQKDDQIRSLMHELTALQARLVRLEEAIRSK